MENNKIFDSRKNIIKGILAIAIFFILGLTDILYLPLEILNMQYSDTFINIYIILANFTIIFILIFIFKNELNSNFTEFKENVSNFLKNYIKYWFFAYGLMFLSNIIIQPFIKEIAKNEQVVQSILELQPVYAFISMVIIAPLLEELVFRFSIRKIIKHDYLYIIISGLLFGAMHIIGSASSWQDWIFILPYGIPGAVFAYAYVKSKNIFVPIYLHAIHNGFSVTIQILLMILKFFA